MLLASDVAGVLLVAPYIRLHIRLKTGRGLKKIGYGIALISVLYLSLKTYCGSF
jgi:hypothetical protein